MILLYSARFLPVRRAAARTNLLGESRMSVADDVGRRGDGAGERGRSMDLLRFPEPVLP